MKKILKQLIPFIKNYKNRVVWNVVFNILYALFSTLSMVAIIPMMDVLFDKTKKVTKKPIWTDLSNILDYLENSLYYNLTDMLNNGAPQKALLLVVAIVIFTFLFKNLFGYLALHHMMHLKNGVLTDLRRDMFEKVIGLPLSFYSKRKKGDVMARMLGDIGQVKDSFFLILALIVKEPLTILFPIYDVYI
jgi:subfamily B ATP-binding cassette protein MsbA